MGSQATNLMRVLVLSSITAGAVTVSCRHPPPEDSQRPLAGSAWRAANIGGRPVASGVNVTISFGKDGNATGVAGCNRYTVSYTQADGRLVFGSIQATKKLCPPPNMNAERDFFSSLRDTARNLRKKSQLVLLDRNGAARVRMVHNELACGPHQCVYHLSSR